MGLNWNVANVADSDTVCFLTIEEDMPSRGLSKGDEILSPLTETLVWLTLSTGVPEITADTATEFLTRVRITEAVHGAMLSKYGADGQREDRPITAQDVLSHVGLRTNASKTTRASFLKSIGEYVARKAADDIEAASVPH